MIKIMKKKTFIINLFKKQIKYKMKEMIKKYEADRQKLIDDSNNDYVKGLRQ